MEIGHTFYSCSTFYCAGNRLFTVCLIPCLNFMVHVQYTFYYFSANKKYPLFSILQERQDHRKWPLKSYFENSFPSSPIQALEIVILCSVGAHLYKIIWGESIPKTLPVPPPLPLQDPPLSPSKAALSPVPPWPRPPPAALPHKPHTAPQFVRSVPHLWWQQQIESKRNRPFTSKTVCQISLNLPFNVIRISRDGH